MEKWLELFFFSVLFLLLNAIVILVCWFSHTINSESRDSRLTEFLDFTENLSGLASNPEALVREAVCSGRHRLAEGEQADAHASSSSSISESGSDDDGDVDEDVFTALPLQTRSGVVDKRLSHRLTSLQLNSPQDEAAMKDLCQDELQTLEERESESFRQELQEMSRRPSSLVTDGMTLLEDLEDGASHVALMQAHQEGLTEYRWYHALVPVGRFDPDYRMVDRNWIADTSRSQLPNGSNRKSN